MSEILIDFVYDNDIKGLKDALKDNVDINETDDDGRTPLIIAARSGYYNIVELLVKRKAKLDIYDTLNNNALGWGVYSGEVKIVKLLISKGLKPDEFKKSGVSPMILALYNQVDDKMMNALYKGKPDIDKQIPSIKMSFKELVNKKYPHYKESMTDYFIKSKIGKFANLLN